MAEEKIHKGKRAAAVDFVSGFRTFVRDYGVIPLAVGVVIGTAINDLIKTLVDGLITPFIALISPQGKLQGLVWEYDGSVFKIGAVLNALITFLLIAWLIYVVAKIILRDDSLLKKK